MRVYETVPVKIPFDTNKITRMTGKDGTVYVRYRVSSWYNPETQQTESVRTSIGKVCEDNPSMMYPNEDYRKYFGLWDDAEEAKAKPDTELRLGTFLVLRKIASEERMPEILRPILGDRTGLFLDLCSYMVVSDENVMQRYERYSHSHPIFSRKRRMYSDSTISNFFQELGGESCDVTFLNAWNESRDKSETVYISYDSTNKRCQAGDVDIAEYGGNPKSGDGPIFNIGLGYDHTNETPLFYENYSGTLVDVKQLQAMQKKAASYGYENVGYILDRGYFSKENVRYMRDNGIPFVIMVRGLKKWIQSLVDKYKLCRFDHMAQYRIPGKDVCGITVREEVERFAVGEMCCHIYFSWDLFATEKKKFDAEIDGMKQELKKLEFKELSKEERDRYGKFFDLRFVQTEDGRPVLAYFNEDEKKENAVFGYFGYFVIITSETMTAEDAYFLYRSRDEIEKLFRAEKSFAPCERVGSNDSVRGKQLVEFGALILYSRMMKSLRKAYNESVSRPNYFNVRGAVAELEKITMGIKPDKRYRLDYALTKEQKEILAVFDLDENYVRKQADVISEIYAGLSPESLMDPYPGKKKARNAP